MNSTPFSLHTGTSSATSIGLEASEICVSPLQNASKPSLVPAPPTSMRALPGSAPGTTPPPPV